MQEGHRGENHPVVSLMYLIFLAVAGALVFSVVGYLVGGLLYGFPDDIATITLTSINYLKVVQIFASTGMFLVPPLILARIESNRLTHYLKLDTTASLYLVMLTPVLMLAAMPLLELTVEVNKSMQLPSFLQSVEEWMKAKEKELETITKKLLVMKNLPDLFLNLFMIAVLPAVSEELMFRGAVQKIFTRWTKNYHWGIWLAAIIFSAIHVQFYGFLPRMLLGALFGYLLVWSNTIWIPILAHFINNGLTVVAAYVYQQKGRSIDEINEVSVSGGPVYIVSFVMLSVLLVVFYRRTQIERNNAS